MAIETQRPITDLSVKMNMGMSVSGRTVSYEPRASTEEYVKRPTGIKLTKGAILAHSYVGMGKTILYDPNTKSMVGIKPSRA